MTMQPTPAIQKLTHDLDTYFTRGRKLTAFEIKGLEKKVNASKDKMDFSDYYVFLGIIAAFRQDAEKVAYNFENALKLTPTDFSIPINYIIALNQIGSYLQALKFGKPLIKTLNNDRLLDELIASAFFLGRFHEAFELLSQLTDPEQSRLYPLIIAAVKIVDLTQLADDDAEQIQQLAFSFLPERKLYFSNTTIEIIDNFIHYGIYVDLPIAEVAPLNFELSLRFAEKLDNRRDDVILFEYKSVETLK